MGEPDLRPIAVPGDIERDVGAGPLGLVVGEVQKTVQDVPDDPVTRDELCESGDVEALVALLTDDVLISMPPVPLEFQGRDIVAQFFASIFSEGRHAYELVPATRANGQMAFGAFLSTSTDIRQGTSLLVLTLAGDRISAITGFDKEVLPLFGLPQSLRR